MRFSIALLSLLVSSSIAASLQKRAAVHDCLDQASVPTDNSGSSTWNADIRPFNSRLFYTPAAVAVPTTIAQIQASVNCGRTSGVKVTAKSGGHSYASLGLGGRNGHLVIVLDRKCCLGSQNLRCEQRLIEFHARHVQCHIEQDDKHGYCTTGCQARTCCQRTLQTREQSYLGRHLSRVSSRPI